MRFLLAIIALLTGFTAADAARPMDAASPTSAASQMEPAEVYASAAVLCAVVQRDFGSVSTGTLQLGCDAILPTGAVETTPVSRADCTRE